MGRLILHYHRLVEENSDHELERQLTIDEITLYQNQVDAMTEVISDLKLERELLHHQNESDRNQAEESKKRTRLTITTLSLSAGVLAVTTLIAILL